jgi:hypothetical protein
MGRVLPTDYDATEPRVPKKDAVIRFRPGKYEHAGHICRGKQRFRSDEEAKHFRENRRMKLGGEYQPTRVYQCPACKGWHITGLDLELARTK